MKVKVKLFASLQEFGPRIQDMELPEGALLEDLLEKLRFPDGLPLLKIVNGRHVSLQQRIRDGDEVALFPPIAGG